MISEKLLKGSVTEKIFFTVMKVAIEKWAFLKIGVQEILWAIRQCLKSR